MLTYNGATLTIAEGIPDLTINPTRQVSLIETAQFGVPPSFINRTNYMNRMQSMEPPRTRMMGPLLTSIVNTAALILVFAGCQAVGPDFQGAASPPMGGEYVTHNITPGGDNQSLSQWWELFGDAQLNALLAKAQQQNPSLEQSIQRINESRARVGITDANFKPDVDLNTSFERRKSSGSAEPFSASNADAFDFFSLGLSSAWEIDLFGKLKRTNEAAHSDLLASELDRDYVRLTLLSDVAATFVEIRLLQNQIDLTNQSLDVQKMTIELVEKRADVGVSTALDAAQAKAFQHRTRADIHLLQQRLEVAYNRLSTLVGEVPSHELRVLVGMGPVPSPTMPGVGFPTDILRSRPDVRSAEARIHAASARIGVAEAELYPQLSLLGTIAVDAKAVSDLFQSDSLVFSVGPSFRWNILHFGRITCNIEVQRAIMNQAYAAYRESVINAVREVEDGLAQHREEQLRADELQKAIAADETSVELSLDRYKIGKANFQRVLDAQQQLLQDIQNQVTARANAAIQLIQTCKAVGGGWGPVGSGAFMGPTCDSGEMGMTVNF